MHLYNTLSKKKELLKPIEPDKISLYVCGVTVYDYCHIGHARVYVVFDTLVRYLHVLGYEVFYARNITDIDDKIINRAKILNISVQELTERFIAAMHEDESKINILPQTIEPRATDNIPEIIIIIDALIQKNYAYIADNGDVYYDVTKFADYGKFAQQDLENLNAGMRVEVLEVKRNPHDFVLWKKAKPTEPAWNSPWGKGRPGWHIECSAMLTKHVGKRVDIHGGGADLKFPHHQNEIAQSEGFLGHKVVNTWMHVGFVEVNKEKMSKSKGNFFTLREVLKDYHPEVIRYFLLASHYRSPLSYSLDNLESAKASLTRFYVAMDGLDLSSFCGERIIPNLKNDKFVKDFYVAMDDDLNTPEALAVMFKLAREINRLRSAQENEKALKIACLLKYLANILGILQDEATVFLQYGVTTANNTEIGKLIKARELMRQNKNWPEADRIRYELEQLGIELEDTPCGTKWKKKS